MTKQTVEYPVVYVINIEESTRSTSVTKRRWTVNSPPPHEANDNVNSDVVSEKSLDLTLEAQLS